jgi:hypothetical protein
MSAFTDLSNNKIGDSTGDMTFLWFFVGHFLLAYLSSLISVYESVGHPFRPSGFEISLKPSVLFPNFFGLQTLLHCTHTQPAEIFDFCTLTTCSNVYFP